MYVTWLKIYQIAGVLYKMAQIRKFAYKNTFTWHGSVHGKDTKCYLFRLLFIKGKSITFLHLQNNLHLLMGSHNKNFLHYTHLLYLMPVCVCKSLEIKKSSQIVTFLDCFLLRGKAIYFGIYKIIYMYLWAAASK